VKIFAEKEIVDSVQDERTEVDISEACKINLEAKIGDMIIVESTPQDFGRVAAQTARQVIQQRIRDAERQAQLNHYQKQLGEIISGIVQAMNAQGLTIGLEMRAEGNLARKDMIPGERFRIHDRTRALVAEVKDSPRGPQIILSRTHRDFLRRLLENEVPEIFHGIVEIRSIAREPGERAKVAVSATQSGIDPVGACVGIRGVRIQAIVRELHEEKIDVIEWNPDPVIFIAKAISPARVSGVYLSEQVGNNKTATVVVPEDQLSLAIGRDGQNARLAAKLTNWRIDIKSLSEAASDSLFKLQNDPALHQVVKISEETIQKISEMLVKKAERRPLTPEEYDQMTHFVDQVERRLSHQLRAEKKPTQVEEKLDLLALSIPEDLFKQNLLDSSLPEHVANSLQEVGITTTGDLIAKMKTNPDDVFRLQGIGPRAMEAITKFTAAILPEEELLQPEVIEKTAEELTEGEAPVSVEITPQITAEPLAESHPVEITVEPSTEEKIEPLAEVIATPVVITESGIGEEAQKTLPGEEEMLEDPALLDKWFALAPENIVPANFEGEEEEGESADKTGKKKKKKKKTHEMEYDPEQGRMIVRKIHKRGKEDWDF
jgi:transcription termination/antitermination protein NusA